jgi:hypothetical protein
MRFGDMMGEFAGFAGGRAAVLLKQRVHLGLAGAGLATDNAEVVGPVPGSLRSLRMGYSGILVGYVVPTRSLVDVTADLVVGAGGVHPEGVDDDDAVFEVPAYWRHFTSPFNRAKTPALLRGRAKMCAATNAERCERPRQPFAPAAISSLKITPWVRTNGGSSRSAHSLIQSDG